MSNSMIFEIPGLDAVVAELNAISADMVSKVLAPIVYKKANGAMTVIKQRYVPVDTGALRSTGSVKPSVIAGDSVTVEMGFGGPAAPYALIVHERLGAHHPIGQAKYLEEPLQMMLGNATPMDGGDGGKSLSEEIISAVAERMTGLRK